MRMPRASSFAALASERASATSSSPRSCSRAASAPPMKPVAPVTKVRPTSGLLEVAAHPLHDLAAVLLVVGADRLADADLDRVPLEPGLELHPVAADRHHVMGPGHVDRHQREVVLGGEHGRAGAQLADAAVARARALG